MNRFELNVYLIECAKHAKHPHALALVPMALAMTPDHDALRAAAFGALDRIEWIDKPSQCLVGIALIIARGQDAASTVEHLFPVLWETVGPDCAAVAAALAQTAAAHAAFAHALDEQQLPDDACDDAQHHAQVSAAVRIALALTDGDAESARRVLDTLTSRGPDVTGEVLWPLRAAALVEVVS